ncbi:MAG: YncE family protein [Myxococcota bacterium]
MLLRAHGSLLNRTLRSALVLTFVLGLAGVEASAQSSFTAFESGPVRPMAMTPDGKRLYVANTPDNRVEVFAINGAGINQIDSIEVGLEPVSVAARTNTEIWVVNHLSDSVSIVTDARDGKARVTRTLLVGDEPRDIVFSGNGRAFITTAHRGQHRMHPTISGVTGAGSPQLTDDPTDNGDQQVGRADVWVFDPAALGDVFGGTPLKIVELFGDTPRALAVSDDGNTVYAAVFHSGNQTAVANEGIICDGFGGAGSCSGDGVTSPGGLGGGTIPGGNPGPSATAVTSPNPGVAAPEVGLIVQYDNASGEWQDERGLNFSNAIRFNLPDHDVFAIDAATLNETDDYEHVGTILFNMIANPVNGNLYVSNTDSQNLTRFEGPGGGGSTVQGNLAQSRITVVDPGTGTVKARHINNHIDYSILKAPAGTKNHSLATPVEMAITSDGATLYVAAFGSSKVGVFSTADLENDAKWDEVGGDDYDPTTASAGYISVSGGGPSGLVLDEARNRLYVSTRFNNAVSVIDLGTGSEVANIPFYNPEPASITTGRPMLYNAFKTSSNGEASCSSCHIFGDFDSLAWDLGDPDAGIGQNPNTINLNLAAGDQNGGADNDEFHPMKGPMTTQTLRGLVTSGHMHWRGDRVDGFFGQDAGDNHDADLSFRNFIVAFDGLTGGDVPPTDVGLQADMQDFSDFMLQVVLPPNPIRDLENTMTSAQLPGRDLQNGRDFFFGDHGGNDCSDGFCTFGGLEGTVGFSCNGCHSLDASQGFFGTGGLHSFENEVQIFKIPHLRNLYQKIGMFGMPDVGFNDPSLSDPAHTGDQVRGTGFLHDGSTDTVYRFFTADVFVNNGAANAGFDGVGAGGDDVQQRRNMEAFMLAFDSDLAPIVGQQVTLNSSNTGDPDTTARVALLEERAGTAFVSAVFDADGNPGNGTQATTECELVARVFEGGIERGYLFDPSIAPDGEYLADTTGAPNLTPAALQALANTAGQEVQYTCAPPGSGERMARDRDEDGVMDGDELVALTDADNPASFPGACNNGLDDDGDGDIDLADAGCKNATWDNEAPQCNDGIDNDGNGNVDLADANCGSSFDKKELKDSSCGLGAELALIGAVLMSVRRRRRQAA